MGLFEYNHSIKDIKFFEAIFETVRMSGVTDQVRIIVPERMRYSLGEDYKDKNIVLRERIRSYRELTKDGFRLKLYVYVQNYEYTTKQDVELQSNYAYLEGRIQLSGRLQSRKYVKRYLDGHAEQKDTYEVSAYAVRVMERADTSKQE